MFANVSPTLVDNSMTLNTLRYVAPIKVGLPYILIWGLEDEKQKDEADEVSMDQRESYEGTGGFRKISSR